MKRGAQLMRLILHNDRKHLRSATFGTYVQTIYLSRTMWEVALAFLAWQNIILSKIEIIIKVSEIGSQMVN